jgi:hypothetical protein
MQNPRSDASHKDYTEFKAQHNNTDRLGTFDFTEETIIREFTHWVIIKNRFPYDNVAKVNDMLVSRKPIGRHYDGTEEEEREYHDILKLLAQEDYYDALIENFPSTKSVKKFAHTHLIIWSNSKKK